MLEILVIAMIIGVLPGAIAASKGHNFVVWWLFGAALFIVALPCSIFLSRNQPGLDNRELSTGASKKCPACAELIRAEAVKCRYCQTDLTPPAVATGAPSTAPWS